MWQREGGEGRGREYQYEFYIWWVFMKDCISDGWQSQGSWMSERPSHKGQERNNGVPTHKERTLTLLIATYTIPYCMCKMVRITHKKPLKFYNFAWKLPHVFSISCFIEPTHIFLPSCLFFPLTHMQYTLCLTWIFIFSLQHFHTNTAHTQTQSNFWGWLQVWS